MASYEFASATMLRPCLRRYGVLSATDASGAAMSRRSSLERRIDSRSSSVSSSTRSPSMSATNASVSSLRNTRPITSCHSSTDGGPFLAVPDASPFLGLAITRFFSVDVVGSGAGSVSPIGLSSGVLAVAATESRFAFRRFRTVVRAGGVFSSGGVSSTVI